MKTSPYTVVALSTATYTALLQLLRRDGVSYARLRTLIKLISAFHSTATTVAAFVVLTQPWTVPPPPPQKSFDTAKAEKTYLDDSENPVIAGKNAWADGITAWETGYLIYDTGALYLDAYLKDRSHGTMAAVRRLLKSSPVFVFHHGALIASLLYLQTYIAAGREKGVWVIMAFFCMNASNPLLHLRWWNYKKTGRHSNTIDMALATIFALTRFGSVYWVMRRYGQHHGLQPFAAMRRQRVTCQLGTGVLTGINLVWLVALLAKMAQRARRIA